MEGVRPVDGDDRALDGNVLPVVGGVGFGEGEGVGEDGGGRTRGQRTEVSGQKEGGKEDPVRKGKT